jgi:hypothetical protein
LCWSFLTSSPDSRTAGVWKEAFVTSSNKMRELPVSPNPDHLRKQAKARLAEMRQRAPGARLGEAQLILAREYGFSGWAALQAEVARRAASPAGFRARLRRVPAAIVPFWRMREAEADAMPQIFFRIGMVMQVGGLLVLLGVVGLVTLAIHQGLPFNGPLAVHHRPAS